MNDFTNHFFYSTSDFYKKIFGCKVYKISLDAGCTCPNRDGSKGYGGCIFCNETGSGDFSADRNKSIKEQIEKAESLVGSKCKTGKFMAYFQNFTNTYGKIPELEKKWTEAAETEGIAGVTIGTRPDCISDEVLDALKRLSEKTFVSVELGLQTSSETTGKLINRQYTDQDFKDAVEKIKTTVPSVHVAAHLIFGLPGENRNVMMDSVDFAVSSGIDGIKISMLHVLKGTKLLEYYEKGGFKCLEMEEYFRLVSEAIERIPENIVIHRITGDGSRKNLVAPLWSLDKKKVLNSMNRYFRENQVYQGKAINLQE